MADERLKIRMITPEGMLSYPHLFEPTQYDEKAPMKHSTVFVFMPGTKLTEIKKAVIEVGKARWSDYVEGVKSGKYHFPLHGGEKATEKGYPEGSVFFNASSDGAPGVVTLVPDPETGKPMFADPKQVYPGVIARLSVTFYTFPAGEKKGNRGVGVGLNNVQIIRDGERLDGRVSPVDEFDADPNAVADLSDLEPTVGAIEDAEDDDLLADFM